MAIRTASHRQTGSKPTRSTRTEVARQKSDDVKETVEAPEEVAVAKAVEEPAVVTATPAPKAEEKVPEPAPAVETEKKTSSSAGKGSGLRSIWKGAITFGMVTIPVRLLSATTDRDLHFNLLHNVCNSRLKQMRWCPVCDREVQFEETVRGYEYSKDNYVRLTEEDFQSVPVPSKHTIDLTAFVKQEQIDPVYFEKSYYLDPDATGRKSYSLLLAALQKRELTAIARIAIREKERLCALRASNGTIVLETLFYADEVREHQATSGQLDVSDKELDMAYKLIDYLTEDFDPEKYKDDYREHVTELIEAKLKGEEIVRTPEVKDEKVIDLMEALRASLEAKAGDKQAKTTSKADEANGNEEPATKRRRGDSRVA